MPVRPRWQREPLGEAVAHVEDELGVPPCVELPVVDVEGATTDVAEQDVVIAQHEFAELETDREAAITAAPD